MSAFQSLLDMNTCLKLRASLSCITAMWPENVCISISQLCADLRKTLKFMHVRKSREICIYNYATCIYTVQYKLLILKVEFFAVEIDYVLEW